MTGVLLCRRQQFFVLTFGLLKAHQDVAAHVGIIQFDLKIRRRLAPGDAIERDLHYLDGVRSEEIRQHIQRPQAAFQTRMIMQHKPAVLPLCAWQVGTLINVGKITKLETMVARNRMTTFVPIS